MGMQYSKLYAHLFRLTDFMLVYAKMLENIIDGFFGCLF